MTCYQSCLSSFYSHTSSQHYFPAPSFYGVLRVRLHLVHVCTTKMHGNFEQIEQGCDRKETMPRPCPFSFFTWVQGRGIFLQIFGFFFLVAVGVAQYKWVFQSKPTVCIVFVVVLRVLFSTTCHGRGGVGCCKLWRPLCID